MGVSSSSAKRRHVSRMALLTSSRSASVDARRRDVPLAPNMLLLLILIIFPRLKTREQALFPTPRTRGVIRVSTMGGLRGDAMGSVTGGGGSGRGEGGEGNRGRRGGEGFQTQMFKLWQILNRKN